jgi:RNA ligase
VQIDELMNVSDLEDMVKNGYVRYGTHKEFSELRIYEYTASAMFDRVWNDVTLKTRGLIVDWNTGKVIARPFDKFMNFGEDTNDYNLLNETVEITDKLDGSLGIFYQYKGTQAIATRGSFHSDQAYRATKLWNVVYQPQMGSISDNWTYLFEIIYPANRIVVDYKGFDDLVLLGARNISSGRELAAKDVTEWKWHKTSTFPYKTLAEALEAPQRPNAEGFVAYFPKLDYRIKIKQADYIALHKVVTRLTKKGIWESLMNKKTLTDMLEVIPDEWHGWLKEVYDELSQNFAFHQIQIRQEFKRILEELPLNYTRKDFAEKAKKSSYAGFLFDILSGKNIDEKVWKLVKPTAE